jgi:iron complex outermembrane receptor protein
LVDGKLAGRIAFKYKENDGLWENHNGPDMAQTKNYGGRLTLNYEPTDNLGIILKGSYGDSDPRAAAARPVGTNPGGLNIAGSTDSLNAKYHEGSIDSIGKSETELSMLNLNLSYDFSDYTIVSVSSWYEGDYLQLSDTDATSQPLASIHWGAETDAISQDLRLVSNYEGPFNFIAGVYYGDEDMDTTVLHDNFIGTPVPNAVFPAQAPQILLSNGTFGQIDRRLDVEKETLAFYTDMNFDLSENWGLNAGLRYTEDENTRDYLNYSRINGGPLTLPPALTGAPVPIVTDPRTEGTYLPGNLTGIDAPLVPPNVGFPVWTHGPLTTDSVAEISVTEREVTGTIALNYIVNEDIMVYGRYSHGYRSGAFNGGLVYLDEGDGAYADPEFVDSYELGMKGEFVDGTVRVNAAAFYYDYTDQQFVNQVGISAILENAGGVDIYGLELETLWMATDALTIQAGLGLIDAEYNELTLTGNDLKGNEPVSAPEVNFNSAADYEMGFSSDWVARLHLDGNFVDDQWFSAYNGGTYTTGDYSDIGQEAYWIWNARVTASDSAERFAVSVWASNLADEEYDAYAINLQGGFGFNYFMEGAPRTYGIDFTYRF